MGSNGQARDEEVVVARRHPLDRVLAGGLTRLAATVLLGMLALLFTVVAFGNITDYSTNEVFVRHVLSMDTIFPDSKLDYRAITSPWMQTAAYTAIISWETMTAVLLWFATVRQARAIGDPIQRRRADRLGVVATLASFMLWGVGFTIIGGEWFASWQSSDWSGIEPAFRYNMLTLFVLVVVIAASRLDPAPDRSSS